MTTRAAEYLVIPADYRAALGGLRWSDADDVVLTPDGQTLAFDRGTWRSLGGFSSAGPPVHFAHVLHLMQLMGIGPISHVEPAVAELRRAMLQARRPLRNAGVFCGHLCRDLPGSAL